jgi:hypothetical protein
MQTGIFSAKKAAQAMSALPFAHEYYLLAL